MQVNQMSLSLARRRPNEDDLSYGQVVPFSFKLGAVYQTDSFIHLSTSIRFQSPAIGFESS